jgi:hypothetical protein
MGSYDGGAATAPDRLSFVFPGLLFSPTEKHGKYTGYYTLQNWRGSLHFAGYVKNQKC